MQGLQAFCYGRCPVWLLLTLAMDSMGFGCMA